MRSRITGFVRRGSLPLAFFLLFTVALFAQDSPVGAPGTQVATEDTPAAATNTDALRNAAQNPVASLISVPIQPNFNFGIGPADRVQNVLNIQPVIPVTLTSNWNLVVRWITPIVYQPIPVPQPPGPPAQTTGVYGLGDMNPTFFVAPKQSKVIWGVGPTLVFPTATNTTYLGQGKLSMGPAVVALVQPKPWTIGFLANNYWSVAGHSNIDKPAVNQFLLQYFVNYNLQKGWYLTSAPILTANWRGTSGVWTVPFGGGVGRIMKLGFQPVNISASFYGNAVYPTGTSPWSMRLSLLSCFPSSPRNSRRCCWSRSSNRCKASRQKSERNTPARCSRTRSGLYETNAFRRIIGFSETWRCAPRKRRKRFADE